MNRILSRSFPLFFVVPMFLMTGCHLMFGPPTPWGGACFRSYLRATDACIVV